MNSGRGGIEAVGHVPLRGGRAGAGGGVSAGRHRARLYGPGAQCGGDPGKFADGRRNQTRALRNDLAALLHVERIPDGRMQFTVVPLLYSSYAKTVGRGEVQSRAPPTLNMVPGLPVMKEELLQAGLQKFAAYRRDHPLPAADGSSTDANAPRKQELVRVDVVEPGKPTPETGPLPQPMVATPMPIAGQPTPRFVASAGPTPLHVSTPAPRPLVTMLATPTPKPALRPWRRSRPCRRARRRCRGCRPMACRCSRSSPRNADPI